MVMSDTMLLTDEECEALGILLLDEAEDAGWDVVFDCAYQLVQAGRPEAALPYLESAGKTLDGLTRRYLSAYSLLDSFKTVSFDKGQEVVSVKVTTDLLQAIRDWCDGNGESE